MTQSSELSQRLTETIGENRVFQCDNNREFLNDYIAQHLEVNPTMVVASNDYVELLQALFAWLPIGDATVRTVGHVNADLLLAASRADWDVDETVGKNPFAGSFGSALNNLEENSVVYLANPNLVTGASFGLRDLRTLAERIPEGLLIVDETLGDFLGISAIPLMQEFGNLCVLRSFTKLYSVDSDKSCALIANSLLAVSLAAEGRLSTITTTQVRTQTSAIESQVVCEQRLIQVREEALRVATELNRLGAQCRITPTDFVLIRVADPARVGNALASSTVRVENLDGYPKLRHYLKYQLKSPASNNVLLGAFEKMPSEYLRLAKMDIRATKLTQAADSSSKSKTTSLTQSGERE